MAVLKQTSPTAWPVAPKPNPSSTVPSASTSSAVGTGSDQPELGDLGFMGGYIAAPAAAVKTMIDARWIVPPPWRFR